MSSNTQPPRIFFGSMAGCPLHNGLSMHFSDDEESHFLHPAENSEKVIERTYLQGWQFDDNDAITYPDSSSVDTDVEEYTTSWIGNPHNEFYTQLRKLVIETTFYELLNISRITKSLVANGRSHNKTVRKIWETLKTELTKLMKILQPQSSVVRESPEKLCEDLVRILILFAKLAVLADVSAENADVFQFDLGRMLKYHSLIEGEFEAADYNDPERLLGVKQEAVEKRVQPWLREFLPVIQGRWEVEMAKWSVPALWKEAGY